MARPKELKKGVKVNLFVEESTALNAAAINNRVKKKDPRTSVSKVTGALIDKEASRLKITDRERAYAKKEKNSARNRPR